MMLETTEARALVSTVSDSSLTSEVTLYRATSHAPNSALRRDLPTFTGKTRHAMYIYI